MSPAALAWMFQILEAAPHLIGIFASLTDMVQSGKDPTQEDIDRLNALRKQLATQIASA